MCIYYNFYALYIAINENEHSEHFQMANFIIPFFSGTKRNGTEHNGKNTFTLAPRKVVDWLERFSLCSVNAVLEVYATLYFFLYYISWCDCLNKCPHINVRTWGKKKTFTYSPLKELGHHISDHGAINSTAILFLPYKESISLDYCQFTGLWVQWPELWYK